MDTSITGQQLNPFKPELHESILKGVQSPDTKPATKPKNYKRLKLLCVIRRIASPRSDVSVLANRVCGSVWSAAPEAMFSEKHIASCLIDPPDMKYGAPSNINIITFHAVPTGDSKALR